MKKKFLSVVLVACALCTTLAPVSKATNTSDIEPYYTGIAQVSVSIDIDSTTLGELTTSYCFVRLYDGYNADVTLSLQRSSDKSNWTTIKDWETSGEEQLEIEKEYFVLEGYYYRVNVLVFVYNENGGIVEIVTKNSAVMP